MTEQTFESLLDLPPSEDDAPKLIPQGSYLAVVKGLPEIGKSSQKETEFRRFAYQLVDIGPDVEERDIEAAGGVDEILGKTVRDTYYITPEAIYRLNQMLENCGITIDGTKSRNQLIDDTPNCEIGIYIRHRPSLDKTRMFHEVGRTFPATKFNQSKAA